MIQLLIAIIAALGVIADPVQPGQNAAPSERVRVGIGLSHVVEPGWMIAEAIVADDAVADIEIINPKRVLIRGKAAGVTDVNLWGENDGERWSGRIDVQIDLSALEEAIARSIPAADVELSFANGAVVASGSLRRAEDADALARLLEATEMPFVDMTRVAAPSQVQIRVRVAEANRVAVRSLGLNTIHTNDDAFFGTTFGGNPNGINIGVPAGTEAGPGLPFAFLGSAGVSDATTLFAGFPGVDLELFLDALEDNQYIRTLAEPTLVAMSGEEASFLAGGEFPVPVPQGSGFGGTVTIEFREFGVRLNFRPVVLGDDTIRLQVAPEVSDLSDVGAVEIDGFSIPALLTRRAATTMVMRSGQTFAMAGLIDRSISARNQSVPGLGSLPILGPLFRSVRYEQGDTELVILATVELVEPLDTAERPLPGDAEGVPNDWELFIEGKLHGSPQKNRPDLPWPRELGLDELKGPGAWARHDMPRRHARPPSRDVADAVLAELNATDDRSDDDAPAVLATEPVEGPLP